MNLCAIHLQWYSDLCPYCSAPKITTASATFTPKNTTTAHNQTPVSEKRAPDGTWSAVVIGGGGGGGTLTWREKLRFITHPDKDGIMGSCGEPCYRCEQDKTIQDFIQNLLDTHTAQTVERIEGIKWKDKGVDLPCDVNEALDQAIAIIQGTPITPSDTPNLDTVNALGEKIEYKPHITPSEEKV